MKANTRSRPSRRYLDHKWNAHNRGIAFLLTFEEWWSIWRESGKWMQRGNQRGQYCMARYGDKGAYEAGNVRICLIEENRAERNANYASMPGETNPAYGKDYWAAMSDEARNQRKLKTSCQWRGKAKPAQQRLRMAMAATGRRRVVRDGRSTWAHPGDFDYPVSVEGIY